MKFKHRIWLLPIMTAVIVTIGISVTSEITSRTSTALQRIQEIQYPTVEALRALRTDLTGVEEALRRAVSENDKLALPSAEEHADGVRKTLQQLADVQPATGTALAAAFEDYYPLASSAARIKLGLEPGDAVATAERAQHSSVTLTTQLTEAQDTAVEALQSLLAGGTANIRRALVATLIMAAVVMAALGLGSWILIGNIFRSLGGEPEAAVETVRAIAAGDFTRVVKLRPTDESSLLHGIETLRSKLGTLIRDVRRASGTVDSAASNINAGIDRLSARTSDQAASLEETASNMEEMMAIVKRNADNAHTANQLATAARDQAERGGSVATRAVAAMSEINSSSRRIADIIGVIDEIAFQTNLLALNAAVEAARAGEQGRGFAVVASEVRNLAQRSAVAAREIKELIADSVNKVQDGSKLVDESGKHLNDIVAAAKKVADIIGEISLASTQQASGLDSVNSTILQMDEMTQQNAMMVSETSSASASMKDQARALTDLIAVFEVDVAEPAPTTAEPTAAPEAKLLPPPKLSPKLARKLQAVPTSAPPDKAAGSDMEWQEF